MKFQTVLAMRSSWCRLATQEARRGASRWAGPLLGDLYSRRTSGRWVRARLGSTTFAGRSLANAANDTTIYDITTQIRSLTLSNGADVDTNGNELVVNGLTTLGGLGMMTLDLQQVAWPLMFWCLVVINVGIVITSCRRVSHLAAALNQTANS